jgi:hypothetical protein
LPGAAKRSLYARFRCGYGLVEAPSFGCTSKWRCGRSVRVARIPTTDRLSCGDPHPALQPGAKRRRACTPGCRPSCRGRC